ncbi:MAG: AbrB/MazE/SpoVT family DNA-binding domain-containing protein [Firmicutes bacterium]|nr:AbrB/MazE/SpoVT family DNA-binding domain-containing protein [Bacillota bacterium]
MQTSIVKWGNSQGIRLPKHLLSSAHISDRDVVEVTVEEDSIIIKKCCKRKKYRTLEELFEGFDGDCTTTEIDWGKPVGKEVW